MDIWCRHYLSLIHIYAVLQLKGLVEQPVTLKGTGEFSFVSVLYQNKKAGEYKLELISGSTVEIGLDGFFIGSADDISNVKVVHTPIPFTPAMEVGKNKKDFILKYKDCENYYGVAWNHRHSEVREILNGDLESFFRRKVHDHVSSRLVGDRKWHYTNAFLRPVVLEPDSEQTIYMLVCTGAVSYTHLDVYKRQRDNFEKELGNFGPRTYAKVCELLLRLQANYLCPAMHDASMAFHRIPENRVVADRFAILMGASHCEPLLFNTASEWKRDKMGEWDYINNKKGVDSVLNVRVKECAPFENVYTLALRCV